MRRIITYIALAILDIFLAGLRIKSKDKDAEQDEAIKELNEKLDEIQDTQDNE